LIIPFYKHILLRVLVPTLKIPSIVYVKREREDDDDEIDDRQEALEALQDMNRTKNKIKELRDKGVIDRVENGLPVPTKDFRDLEEIKQEYGTHFDEDSNNTLKEGLEEIDEYLNEEINSIHKGYSSQESEYKRKKMDDNTENTSSSTGNTSSSSSSSTGDKPSSSGGDKPSSSGGDDDFPAEMPSFLDDFD